VEFALVAPLVLLLLFGIIGYGFMLTFRQALSQGAAEGARSAAVWSASYSPTQEPDRVAAARASVDEALGSYGVSCSDLATCAVEIVPCGGAAGPAKCATVKVSYPYRAHPIFVRLPFIPLPETVEFEARARVS
jgi:hypothetical protein